MKIDPSILDLLLESMNEGIKEINTLIRGSTNRDTVAALARIAHKLKGEATVVGLVSLSELIIRLEDALERMERLEKIDKAHLLVVANHLKKIVKVCDHLRKSSANARKKTPQTKMINKGNTSKGISAALQVLAMNVSRSCGKQVRLNLDGFDLSDYSSVHQHKIQDMVIQLVRNAITHGIETPSARKKNGKAISGTVAVVSRRTKNGLVIAVRDNGGGINLDQVRKRLVVKYDHNVMSVAKLPTEKLLRSLFLPGFSTLSKQEKHAGRGVGLDLVKVHAESLGGKVEVAYKAKRYTQFLIHLPIKRTTNVTPLRTRKQLRKAMPKAANSTMVNLPVLVDIA
ncbi:Chemotaxis protein histidine kinase and related kinases [Alteromonadaceae bacterium Bs31]|nr:Chemotaxis protein histidine kinase and related kinases [Alteromonadaceae bacterium Bs31]